MVTSNTGSPSHIQMLEEVHTVNYISIPDWLEDD